MIAKQFEDHDDTGSTACYDHAMESVQSLSMSVCCLLSLHSSMSPCCDTHVTMSQTYALREAIIAQLLGYTMPEADQGIAGDKLVAAVKARMDAWRTQIDDAVVAVLTSMADLRDEVEKKEVS